MCTFEVEYVLSKRSLLEHPAFIKPDMPRDERASEAAFLKERWSLAQRGVDRKSIKLRNGHIYIDNTLYGKLEKSNNAAFIQLFAHPPNLPPLRAPQVTI